jgi:hypothetical protein
MIQLVQNPGQGMTTFKGRIDRLDVATVAKRMFNEGFTKSTILRITGINEDEFLMMVRDLQRSAPSLV